MNNCSELLKEKLKQYSVEQIIFTKHALEQAIFRDVNLEEIKQNIINPFRLTYALSQDANNPSEQKYDCYFKYSNTQCQRYNLIVNHNCIVCTVIKINRRWQKQIERRLK